MLPFLKNKKEGGMSAPVEPSLKRDPDEDADESFGMLDAITEDLMEAFEKKDKGLLRSTLEAFMDHIKYEDELQDQDME